MDFDYFFSNFGDFHCFSWIFAEFCQILPPQKKIVLEGSTAAGQSEFCGEPNSRISNV